jgi:hypothetical protein
MGIPVSSNFDLNSQLPLDDRTVAIDITARDAITPIERYAGLICYVQSDNTTYQLVGGITNSHWQVFGGAGAGSTPDFQLDGGPIIQDPVNGYYKLDGGSIL